MIVTVVDYDRDKIELLIQHLAEEKYCPSAYDLDDLAMADECCEVDCEDCWKQALGKATITKLK